MKTQRTGFAATVPRPTWAVCVKLVSLFSSKLAKDNRIIMQ